MAADGHPGPHTGKPRREASVGRMELVPSTTTSAGKPFHLLCQAGRALVAAPLSQVLETMRPLPVTPLVGLPPFLPGVAIIRGKPTPIVDVGAILSPPECREPARFVVLNCQQRVLGLAFERVLGVRELPAAILQRTPPLLRAAASAVVEAIGALDEQLLLVLRAARVIPEETWKVLESAGTRA